MDKPSGMDPVTEGWSRFYGGFLLARRRGAHDLSVLDRLRRVRAALEACPGQPVDLTAMARSACFSRFHFLRLFRQAYGETPGRCLARLRLERARALLETSDRSATDICWEVEYESLASFSHAFRRHAGVPPQHYRRRFVAVPRAVGRPLRIPGCFLAMYG